MRSLAEKMGLKLRKKIEDEDETSKSSNGNDNGNDDGAEKNKSSMRALLVMPMLMAGLLLFILVLVLVVRYVQKSPTRRHTILDNVTNSIRGGDAVSNQVVNMEAEPEHHAEGEAEGQGEQQPEGEERPDQQQQDTGSSVSIYDGLIKVSLGKRVVDLAIEVSGSSGSDSSMTVSKGPHTMRAYTTTSTSCNSPSMLSLRFVGEALVYVPLQPTATSPDTLVGNFSIPITGTYELDARYYGCTTATATDYVKLDEPVVLTVVDSPSSSTAAPYLPVSQTTLPLFPTGFWLSKKLFQQDETVKSDHVWIAQDKFTPGKSPADKFYQTSARGRDSTVLLSEATPFNTRSFGQLSNYEVVCWVGSDTSAASNELFLSLRTQVSAAQRRFKFHYYPVTSFTAYDRDWIDRRMSRKCKHTFVSLEEFDDDDKTTTPQSTLSQDQYRTEITRFLKEIHGCMHDDTWNIWMVTLHRSNPKTRKLCHSPSLPRTHHHPCNDVLFDMFAKKELPPNIYLMDNTDVTNPEFEDDTVSSAAASTIAMRLFSIIANGVERWRAVGQIGKVTGLIRNGVTENDPADACFLNSTASTLGAVGVTAQTT